MIEIYKTNELKLGALILANIPNCEVQILEEENSIRKIIAITYPKVFKNEVNKLENEFINKKAQTNVYSYNKALNTIRDKLKGILSK